MAMSLCFICNAPIHDEDGSGIALDAHMAFNHGLIPGYRHIRNGVRVDSRDDFYLVSREFEPERELPPYSYHTWNMRFGEGVEPAFYEAERCLAEVGCLAKRQADRVYCAMH